MILAARCRTVFLQVENPERDALQRKRKIRSRMLLERAEKSKLDIARAYGLLLIGGDRTWRKYHHQLDGQYVQCFALLQSNKGTGVNNKFLKQWRRLVFEVISTFHLYNH